MLPDSERWDIEKYIKQNHLDIKKKLISLRLSNITTQQIRIKDPSFNLINNNFKKIPRSRATFRIGISSFNQKTKTEYWKRCTQISIRKSLTVAAKATNRLSFSFTGYIINPCITSAFTW